MPRNRGVAADAVVRTWAMVAVDRAVYRVPLWDSASLMRQFRRLSRQSVGTILREFANAGLIRIGRERIEVLNEDGLRTIVTSKP